MTTRRPSYGTMTDVAAPPLPTLIIAGFSKAGTTTLFDALARHPDVHPASTKETRFFQAVRYGEPLGPLDHYRGYFRGYGGQSVVLEGTPDYVYGGDATAQAIRAACAPKILLILRDPAARVRSFFQFLQSRQELPAEMTLADYVETCRSMPDEEMNRRDRNSYTGLWGGLYARFLPAWTDLYGDDCKLLFFERMVAQPADVLAEVAAWLDIDQAGFPTGPLPSENATARYRSPTLFRVAMRLAKAGRPILHYHPALARRAKRSFAVLNEAPAVAVDVPDDLRSWLADYYRESNRAVATLAAGRVPDELPAWVTDA
jgi:hypothetical protein